MVSWWWRSGRRSGWSACSGSSSKRWSARSDSIGSAGGGCHEIEDLQGRLLVREVAPMPHRLAELGVEALCGVDDTDDGAHGCSLALAASTHGGLSSSLDRCSFWAREPLPRRYQAAKRRHRAQ